jgi:hypothetical protein
MNMGVYAYVALELDGAGSEQRHGIVAIFGYGQTDIRQLEQVQRGEMRSSRLELSPHGSRHH